MTTGQRIKAARKKVGLTQKELGAKLGVAYQTLAQWENDLRNPKLETLQRIANALEVSIYELIDGDDLKRAVIYGEGLDGGKAQVVSETVSNIHAHIGAAQLMEPELSLNRHRSIEIPDFSFRLGSGKSPLLNTLIKTTNDPQCRIVAALGKLNEEGQEKAAERVEELTEIPRYQVQEPPTDAPQSTPAPQEDKDTTPAETPSEGSQEPPEGRIQSITMFCPICGMTLRGDPATGKAFCHYCNRSFPLPKKARGPRR